MTVVAVADAGPLIHLAEIDALALFSAFEELYVPETVYDELQSGGVPSGMKSLPYERVPSEVSAATDTELDAGETAALAVALEREAILLTDDLEARDAAKDANVEVHGSLGVIALAYSTGRLEKTDAMNQMRALQRETSLFITDAVVERGIDMLGGK